MTEDVSRDASTREETTVGLSGALPQGAPADQPRLEKGASVGPYRVESVLGTGGMGVVYHAHDPRLNRSVALKLLRPRASRLEGSEGKNRMIREAQAMARLSHPNVVEVYDVGLHANDLYIAMELVEGSSLSDWLDQSRRSIPEILEVLIQAGRGLESAHQQDLLHRDFKLSNVLVGIDGRARVLDFGLARAVADDEEAPESSASISDLQIGSSSLCSGLTRAGTLVGTPSYMSPEQHAGAQLDARSDQFNFCVAAYRALYGVLPFTGKTMKQYASDVVAGRLRDPPASTAVPRRVHLALVRGLASSPDDRWPTMTELLAAISAVEQRRSRALWGAAGTTAVVTAVLIWNASERGASMCASSSDRLQGIWDETRRASLRDAFVSVEVGYAEQTWIRVEKKLDTWTEDWSAAYVGACEGSRDSKQARAVLDARMACLSRHLGALSAMLDALSEPDAEMLSTAVEAIDDLPPAQRCSAAAVSTTVSELVDDPETAAKAEDVRAELTRLRAIGRAGQYERVLEELQVLSTRAETLGEHPAYGRVLLAIGDYRGRRGDFEPAFEALERAVWIGLQNRDDELVVDAATEIIFLESVRVDPEGAEEWIRHADAALTRLGQRDSHDEYWNALGSLRYQAGDYDEAEEAFSRSLKIVEAEDGVSSASAGQILGNLGTIYQARGEIGEAKKTYERALALQEQGLGNAHPQVAVTLLNLATTYYAEADYDKAERANRQGIAVLEDARQFADAAKGRINLGNAIDSQGRPAEAREEYMRARTAAERAFGPDHAFVGLAVSAIGLTYFNEGSLDEAVVHYHKALQILQAALGPQHRMLATTSTNLGDAYASLGQHDKALAAFQRTLEIARVEPGMETRKQEVLVRIGSAHVDLGQYEQARAAFDQIQPDLVDLDPTRRAEHQLLVARKLQTIGAPTEEIRAWAERAHHSYQEGENDEGETAAQRFLDGL